jgi:hypothetical protein
MPALVLRDADLRSAPQDEAFEAQPLRGLAPQDEGFERPV